MHPTKNYEAVADAIKLLGAWAHVQKSVWYVKSEHTASTAADKIWAAMDANDSLIVVDATNNTAAWYNLKPEVSAFLKDRWYQARAA